MSSRRETRLRKEFLLRKQAESHQILRNEKKKLLKSAITEKKSVPTEIVPEARRLKHEIEMDILPFEDKKSIDDEYANIGSGREPKVCVTTSRDPSSRLKQFSKYVISPISVKMFCLLFLTIFLGLFSI
jgi:U3 small nucleolar ribonucleoprotein protein IMP4